ncbi:MAG: carboxymuconolactone decarboxylase family protein [Bacteroidota bacterium]
MSLSKRLQTTRDETRVTELLTRVQEKLGEIPQAYHTLAINQNFLNDTLYNLKKNMVEGALDLKTKHLIAVAIAAVSGGPHMVQARAHEAQKDGVTDDQIAEALSVAGSIASYNVFYKFQHLAGPGYEDFKPGYKLSVFLRPAVLTVFQVEMICAIVSTVNDCPYCVKGHLAKCRELGATVPQIEEALRVGALISGVATFTKVE